MRLYIQRTPYMKYLFKTVLFIIISTASYHSVSSQSMYVSSGIGSTHYFDLIKEGHLESDYDAGVHYSFKIGFTELGSIALLDDIAFRFEKQSGNIHYSSNFIGCGLGFPVGLLYTDEYFQKYTLSAISYPFKFEMTNHFYIKSGFALSKTFLHSSQSTNELESPNDDIPFESNIENRNVTADVVFEIQLGKINIGTGLLLSPVYNAAISIMPEFNNEYRTQSFRHSLGLAVLWGLRKK